MGAGDKYLEEGSGGLPGDKYLDDAPTPPTKPAKKRGVMERFFGMDAEDIRSPDDYAGTPTGREAKSLYHGVAQAMTLGQADKGRTDVDPNWETMGKTFGMLGSAVAGPARAAGAVTSAAVKAVPRAAAGAGLFSRIASGLGRTATAGAVGGGTGAAMGAVEDGKAGAKTGGALGALFGAGGQALGEVGGVSADFLMKYPWVRRYFEAADDGRLARVKAEAASGEIPAGRQGMRKAAERTQAQVESRLSALDDEAGSQYQSAVAPHLEKPLDTAPVRQRVLETGVSSRPLSAGDVHRPTDVVKRGGRVLKDLEVDPRVQDALQVRRGLDADAGWGAQAPTPEQLAAREVRSGVRQGIRDAAPEVGAADDAFSAAKAKTHRARDIVYRREEGGRYADAAPTPQGDELEALVPKLRVGDETQGATNLGRIGDQSEEGLRYTRHLEELSEMDPAFKEALDYLLAKKAFEASRFTLRPAIQDNLSTATSLGGKMGLLGQFGNALGVRAKPIAEGAAKVGSKASRSGGFFGAIGAASRKDDKEKKR